MSRIARFMLLLAVVLALAPLPAQAQQGNFTVTIPPAATVGQGFALTVTATGRA